MNHLSDINKKIIHQTKIIFTSPVKTFVIIAALIGLLMIFLAPPLTGGDEEAHFVRAYGISKGDFRLYDTRKVSVPKSFLKTIGCFQTKTSEPGFMYRYNYSNYGINKKISLKCALKLPLDENDTELLDTTAQFYSPISYIPQVSAILLGRLFNAPIVIMTYLIRIFVLASYILMIGFAIKLIPIRKWALAGVALLPTPILFLINPGGDYLLFGSISILLAVVIRSVYISKEQLNRENNFLTTILAIASVVMVLPKGIFPGICLLPLVVFYGGLKYQKIRKVIIILAAITAGLCWQIYGINTDLVTMGAGMNSILDFPSAFVRTMFTRWVDTDFIYIGDNVGNIPVQGNHLGMPAIIISLINMLFAVYLFTSYPEKSKNLLSKRQNLALVYTIIICSLAIIVGSFGALFVGASYLQDAGGAIRGVQARYFYPAFFALACLPLIHKIQFKNESYMAKIVIFGSIICLSSLVLITVFAYHWWNPFGIM